jgi:multiple sugar transport system permease protein
MTNNRTKSTLVTYSMLLPFTFFFCVFILFPIIAAIGLSFTDFNMLQIPKFVGLDNYIRMLFFDDVYMKALKNTLIFGLITGPLGYFLSFFFAWTINEFGRRIRAILTLIFYAPTLTGNIFFIWIYLFSGDSQGLINNWMIRLGIIQEPILWLSDTRYNLFICVIVILWMSMGIGFLAFIAGFQSQNNELYEAGAIDGIRNRFQELIYITIPQMRSVLLFGAVMTISSSFAVGYQNAQLTGFPSTDYSTHTLVLHMADYGSTRFEMGYASAIAVTIFFLMLLIWKYVEKILAKFSYE